MPLRQAQDTGARRGSRRRPCAAGGHGCSCRPGGRERHRPAGGPRASGPARHRKEGTMLILLETMMALATAAVLFLGLMAATAAPPVILALLAGLGAALYLARRSEERAIARTAASRTAQPAE
ncbi:hypothetical protein D1114_09730 [Cereibacter sphaeroides]|uniref:Uncharacterized protein n=1 Tax=Cereibacter sphaeroides TaxID=1063 RepID=A0AAX1ULN6_CERSP|nr:hypothetical protein D1114_09730 [Cereibacter sphaeroides]